MPRRRDRDQSQTDYVNIYYGFVVWRAIFSVAGKVLGGLAVVLYFIAYSIWPDEAPQLFADFVIFAIGAGALAVVWLIGRVIYYVMFPPNPASMPEWVPHGAIANPKGDWFDDRKRPLWRREGNQWVPIIYKDCCEPDSTKSPSPML